jgi:hypothetical protein
MMYVEINLYHVLKSLVYFEDAEAEPNPILSLGGEDWEWENVKKFFEKHLKDSRVVCFKMGLNGRILIANE